MLSCIGALWPRIGRKACLNRYSEARRRARILGYDHIASEQLLRSPIEQVLERLEAFAAKGLIEDKGARTALLGTEARPSFLLSRLSEEYETAVRDETGDLSPDQLRAWRTGPIRGVAQFVKVVGDKPVTAITESDGIDYVEWWRERVLEEDVAARMASKDIGRLSRMLTEVSVRRRLNRPDIFKGLRLRGDVGHSRQPYAPDFIPRQLLAGDGPAGLNEDARLIRHVTIETGLQPSEAVNLRDGTISTRTNIPQSRLLAALR